MEARSSNRRTAANVTPLLRSIAKELVARTMAIVEIESQIEFIETHAPEDRAELNALVASLANHRRELRLADKELQRLGWRRDEERPMRFLAAEKGEQREEGWQLQGTGFYRSLDAPTEE